MFILQQCSEPYNGENFHPIEPGRSFQGFSRPSQFKKGGEGKFFFFFLRGGRGAEFRISDSPKKERKNSLTLSLVSGEEIKVCEQASPLLPSLGHCLVRSVLFDSILHLSMFFGIG